MAVVAKDLLDSMDSDSCDMISRSIESATLALADRINDVVAEKNGNNERYLDAAPEVLIHQLIRILPHNFCSYVQSHRNCLEQTFSTEEIEKIGDQHKSLCDWYHHQHDTRSSINSFDDTSSYHVARVGLQNRYYVLQCFSGGLANIFSGTSTIESEILMMKYEETTIVWTWKT